MKNYDVIIDDEAVILFYSTYGFEHYKYSCTKVFYTGENIRPNFNDCDFAFSFDFSPSPKNYRLPLYAFYDDVEKLVKSPDSQSEGKKKSKFCCFLVSNPVSTIRNNFFVELSKRKHVDSGGSVYNNLNGLVKEKREFIKDYKFVIAFENSSYPGYVTEKIFEPLLEDCIPIYWGSPEINKDFNTKRFINCHDYNSFEEVIDLVLEIDDDHEKYLNYVKQPAFENNRVNEFVKDSNISKKLDEIILYNAKRSFFLKTFQFLRAWFCTAQNNLRKVSNRITSFNAIIK